MVILKYLVIKSFIINNLSDDEQIDTGYTVEFSLRNCLFYGWYTQNDKCLSNKL